ncbi:MAG: acyl-CoA dehydrogenase [Acidimicrobiales bacterium]|nr:acyl-CoA dehydrogenase [Acidimicrobiales bacterium]RZV45265.1 MAG: acyl-CoA dehydrogenase [Acidimicrobiales bacterium]
MTDTGQEASAWVADNWDPELTVGEWWQRLADAGYSHPTLPEAAGGRGYDRSGNVAVRKAIAAGGAVGPPTGLGMMLAAPTIAKNGTPDQIERMVKPILNGQHAWCQLFSEPNAGSDLASIQTSAIRDGDEFVVNGQKVWTSGGKIADKGMLIARTDASKPKHRGITYFSFDMHQSGVDVRPLTEMTGRAIFNEVFIDDARVAADDLIGDDGDGWRVANDTLMFERMSLGANPVPLTSCAPGTVAKNLERRVGGLMDRGRSGEDGVPSPNLALWQRLVDRAREDGLLDDPLLRQKLVDFWSLAEVNRLTAMRGRSKGASPASPNISKLMMSELFRKGSELGATVLGADAMLHEDEGLNSLVQELMLFSPGPSIYGGTDQIQRNIIGERALGLQREPGPDKDTPFTELAKN